MFSFLPSFLSSYFSCLVFLLFLFFLNFFSLPVSPLIHSAKTTTARMATPFGERPKANCDAVSLYLNIVSLFFSLSLSLATATRPSFPPCASTFPPFNTLPTLRVWKRTYVRTYVDTYVHGACMRVCVCASVSSD